MLCRRGKPGRQLLHWLVNAICICSEHWATDSDKKNRLASARVPFPMPPVNVFSGHVFEDFASSVALFFCCCFFFQSEWEDASSGETGDEAVRLYSELLTYTRVRRFSIDKLFIVLHKGESICFGRSWTSRGYCLGWLNWVTLIISLYRKMAQTSAALDHTL